MGNMNINILRVKLDVVVNGSIGLLLLKFILVILLKPFLVLLGKNPKIGMLRCWLLKNLRRVRTNNN